LGSYSGISLSTNPHERHRFSPEIIRHAVRLYHRFNLSHRNIEDLHAERGIEASYESVQLWCNKFGPPFSKRLKRRHPGFGDSLFVDKVFVTIAGQRHYLWRAIHQDGEVVDALLREPRDAMAARRFFRHLLAHLGGRPRAIVTDKPRIYAVARRELLPTAPTAASSPTEPIPSPSDRTPDRAGSGDHAGQEVAAGRTNGGRTGREA